MVSDDSDEDDSPVSEQVSGLDESNLGVEAAVRVEGEPGTKRRKIYSKEQTESDNLPPELQHLRLSERKFRPVVYQTYAALQGLGLSIPESSNAVRVVGNMMFNRKWKNAEKDQIIFDCDTLPTARNLRMSLQVAS